MIVHVVRCDGEACGMEQPLDSWSGYAVTASGESVPAYSVPSEWHQIDGHHFCSFRCLADYAHAKAQAQS